MLGEVFISGLRINEIGGKANWWLFSSLLKSRYKSGTKLLFSFCEQMHQ